MPRAVLLRPTPSALVRRPARALGVGALVVGLLLAAGGSSASAAPTTTPVDLGSASHFSILAGAALTLGAGANLIAGDIGVGAALTGAHTGPGVVHSSDAVFQAAQHDVRLAYADAQSRTPTSALKNSPTGDVVYPGVSHLDSAYTLAAGPVGGAVVLDAEGDPDAVFILQIGGAMTMGAGSTVTLVHGARAGNVFWAVGGAFTMGADAVFAGTVMTDAAAAATTGAGAKVDGRVFSGAAQTHGADASFSGVSPRTPVPTFTTAGGPFTLTGCVDGTPGTGTLSRALTVTVTPGTPGTTSVDLGLVQAPYYGASHEVADGGAFAFTVPAGTPFDCANIQTGTSAPSLGLLVSDGSGTQVSDSVPLTAFDEPTAA